MVVLPMIIETPAKPIGGQRTEWKSGKPPFARPLWIPAFAGMT